MKKIRVEKVCDNTMDAYEGLNCNKYTSGIIDLEKIEKHKKIKYISTLLHEIGLGPGLYLLMQLEELEMYEDCEYLHKAIERVKWEKHITKLPNRWNKFVFGKYAKTLIHLSEFEINQELEQICKRLRVKINLY